jgi:hypothetical protein
MKEFIENIIYFIIIATILSVIKHFQGFEASVLAGLTYAISDIFEVRNKLKS